jgi:hypothetical protein
MFWIAKVKGIVGDAISNLFIGAWGAVLAPSPMRRVGYCCLYCTIFYLHFYDISLHTT